VLAAGLIRRDRRAIATALLVVFLYGTLVWGVLPIEPRMSWQTHLAAAIVGVMLALVLRDRDVPLRRQYSWEGVPDEDPEIPPEATIVPAASVPPREQLH
jgi:membrane associated rhomboid family serine protease